MAGGEAAGAEGLTYELPHGSIWPILVGLGISALVTSLVFGPPWIYLGGALFALTGLGWLHEDRKWWEEHVGTGHAPGRWGVLLFIGSEIMIFGGLFATYFNFRAGAPVWPPEHVHLPIGTTGLFTVILLASGVTMHWAHQAIRIGKKKYFQGHLLLTILLGAIFMGAQANEYMTLIGEGVTLGSSHFATTFYLLTGTHGLHVIAGLVALAIVAYRAFVHDQFDQQRHVLLEGAAIYWHFVDLVWVFVYAIVYLQWV